MASWKTFPCVVGSILPSRSTITSTDSTFLGVLAGAAIELRRKTPPGVLTLARVGERNLELIRNLGLHRLATVDAGGFPMNFTGGAQALDSKAKTEIESARLVLE